VFAGLVAFSALTVDWATGRATSLWKQWGMVEVGTG